MNYAQIRKMDISDGPGCRVSFFVQGCSFGCEGCFNKITWDFNGGTKFTEKTINQIIELAKPDYISGLSILGGEPLHEKNRVGILLLIDEFKKAYPNKTIWLWTGYKFEDIKKYIILSPIDVIVDGQFELAKFDPKLLYKGSSNQRVIDVKATLKNKKNKIILYK